MTQVAVDGGLWYPSQAIQLGKSFAGFFGAAGPVAATGERFAMFGRINIAGRGTKTMGGGSSSIAFKVNSLTWANGASTMDIGIQDISVSAGPPMEPDGVFDTKITLAGGAGLATGWNIKSFASATGTKSIANGDFIALVFDFTNKAGADTVSYDANYWPANYGQQPACCYRTGGAWAALSDRAPLAWFIFSDGTVGWFDGCMPINSNDAIDTTDDAANPDERGMIFQLPWDCFIDGILWYGGIENALSDFTMRLYSTPLGTPSVVSAASLSLLGENTVAIAARSPWFLPFSNKVSISKNVDYAIAWKGLNTGDIYACRFDLPDTTYRAFFSNGALLRKGSRQWATGSDPATAFVEESPALTIYKMAVRVCSFDDGTGAGSSGGSRSRIQTGY